jgi:hypothetical protein
MVGHGNFMRMITIVRLAQNINIIKTHVIKQWQDCEYSQVLPDEIAITARTPPDSGKQKPNSL